jgi:hypothetical protein
MSTNNHCVMKKEAITFLKTIVYVAIGVLIANAIERKYLKTKTSIPLEAV